MKPTGLDVLRVMSPEELAKVPKLTREEIQEALAQGQAAMDLAEARRGCPPLPDVRVR